MIKPMILLVVFFTIMSCHKEKGFIEIPYKTTSPFYSIELLNAPLHEYVKKNKIKSIGIRYGNKNVEDHLVFDHDGFLRSNRIYITSKAEYTYEGNRLIKITNPGPIYSSLDAEYIEFQYNEDNKVVHANIKIENKHNHTHPEVGYFYHKDSTEIIAYDSIPKYWYEKTVFIKDNSGNIIKEKFYEFNELKHSIDYNYKSNVLTSKVWFDRKGSPIRFDSLSNGLVVRSIGALNDTCYNVYNEQGIRSSCLENNLYISKY